jgi:hypothetical protein
VFRRNMSPSSYGYSTSYHRVESSVPYGPVYAFYTIPELLFVPELHTCTYKYILYPFISFHFCFASEKYTKTSKFPF